MKVALIIAAIVVAVLALKVTYDRGERAGTVAAEAMRKRVLDDANARNAAVQSSLDAATARYAELHAQALADRRAADQPTIDRVETRIVEQPNCSIDPEIIRLRNELRAQP